MGCQVRSQPVSSCLAGKERTRFLLPASMAEGPAADDASKGLEELRNLFDSLDKDHDGKVTGKEWGKKVKENQSLLSKYFGGSTLKEIGSAFSRIDADGNKSLSWEEFVVAAGLALPPAPEPEAGDASK